MQLSLGTATIVHICHAIAARYISLLPGRIPGAPATYPKQTRLPALHPLMGATSHPLVCANNVATRYHSRGKVTILMFFVFALIGK
ncbi:UNVERIFIED_CONTAM: hypothetical protein FKN15_050708 [Acipenser sinensis]